MNASVPGALGTSRSRPGLRGLVERDGRDGRVTPAATATVDRSNSRPTTAAAREKVVGCFGQPRKASPNDIAHALGKTELGQRPIGGPYPVALEDRAGLREVGNDLLGEERVPVGLVVQCGDELRRRLVTGAIVEQRTDRLLLETAERHPLDARIASEVGEQLAQRMAAVDIGVTVGAQHEHRPASFAAQDPPEQRQRRLIGPVEVVEHQEQRAVAGDLREKRVDRVEQPRTI